MKSGALLVNTSRGLLVDEVRPLAALHGGRLTAAVDVYDEEPLPADHPLRSAPNVIHTPHVGYVTEATYDRFFTEIVEDIEAYLEGSSAPRPLCLTAVRCRKLAPSALE